MRHQGRCDMWSSATSPVCSRRHGYLILTATLASCFTVPGHPPHLFAYRALAAIDVPRHTFPHWHVRRLTSVSPID